MISTISSVLIVGSGSAGQRHARTMRQLLPDSRITVVRRQRNQPPLASLAALNIDMVSSLEQGVSTSPQVVVIASPATFHQQDAHVISDSCSCVLVEKPLAADLSSGIELAAELTRRDIITSVGYHLRCSETVTRLKNFLDQRDKSHLRSVKLSYLQHLSLWRPEIDPRSSVTARSELGGGVLLELSHEFDALRYLLADVSSVDQCVLGFENAPTDGIVETEALVNLTIDTGIDVTVQLDMTSPVPSRLWDLLAGTIIAKLPDGSELPLHQSSPGERDRAGSSMLFQFLQSYDNGSPPPCSLLDGLKALAVVSAAKESFSTSGEVSIDHQRIEMTNHR